MKYLLIAILICIFSFSATSQKLSPLQYELIHSMQQGDRLYRTLIGYQLVTKYIDDGRDFYDSKWYKSATFKAVKRRKLIKQLSTDSKDKGYGEYVLTPLGKTLNK